MPYACVRGINHFYEWIPADADSSQRRLTKPVMVFVHGWAGSATYWRSTAHALSDQFNCLLYDMRGFGRSVLSSPERMTADELGYELEAFADDLAGLLDELGLSRVYLNAHSMGASVALFFLNRHCDRTERAILTCNGIFEYDQKAFEAFHRFGGYVVAWRPAWLSAIPFVPHLFMARFLRQPIPPAEKLAFLKDFLEADHETARQTILTSVSKRATEIMPQEYLQLRTPTLLVSGQYDQIIPAHLGSQAAALNTLVEHVVIPDTGHFPMLEAPDTYLQIVQQFLQV